MVTTTEADFAAFVQKSQEKQAKPQPVGKLSGKEIQQLPYVCGFCNAGFHFPGKRIKGAVCKMTYKIGRLPEIICFCDCTETERLFQDMLRASGKTASIDSEPPPILPASWLQSPIVATVETPDDGNADVGSTTPDAMTLNTGSLGRIEKGELERAVFEVCLDGLQGNVTVPATGMTVNWIVFEITLRTSMVNQIYPGAVSAVLQRWAKIMWCTLEEKPLRLVDMTDQLKHVGPTNMRADIAAAQHRFRLRRS